MTLPFPTLQSIRPPIAQDLGSAPRVVVLASGTGSNFRAILEAVKQGQLQAEIVGLICNIKGAGCISIAATYGIPTVVLPHTSYKTRVAFDGAVVEALQRLEADWVVMAGWMRIATPTLVTAYPNRITNLHPSLLPSFRGLNAIEQALAAGVTITGCTVHLVTESLDDGPIIGQAALEITPDDTLETLSGRIHQLEHLLYPAALQALFAG